MNQLNIYNNVQISGIVLGTEIKSIALRVMQFFRRKKVDKYNKIRISINENV